MTKPDAVDVVGGGLNATDTIIPVPEYPARGSKVAFRSASVLPGGQVASAVAACQMWGLRTRYVGRVGDVAAGHLHREEFARLGVEARLVTAEGCASQQAFILVDDKGERTVLWKRDERLTLRPAELQREWVTDARGGDDKGERDVLWKRDERLTLRPAELQREWVTDARVLHVDGHDTAAAAVAAGWAREASVPVIADLDELYPGVEELLPKLDY